MTPVDLMVARMRATNAVAIRIAPVFVVVFALLTIADGLNIYRCGWFWTSIGTLLSALAWATGRGEISLLRGNVAMIFLIVGVSAGLTPFLAPYLLPYVAV